MSYSSGFSRKPRVTAQDLQDFATLEELRADPILAGELLLDRDYHPLQKLAMWGMWSHPFSMLDEGRGCGKGLVASARLMTSLGLKTFEEVAPEDVLSSIKEKAVPADGHISVMGPEGMRRVKSWISHGKIPTRTFTTSRGVKITLCMTNPTLSIEKGQLAWKKPQDLSVGDHLVLQRDYKGWQYEDNGLVPELARVLGYLVGDGHVSQPTSYGLTNADEKVISDFVRVHEGMGISPRVTQHKLSSVTRVATVNGRQAREALEDLGLSRRKAHEKTVPSSIWGASREAQRQFLRGLFETDGTSDKLGRVYFCTTSPKLAHEVQLLLLTFGVIAKIREKKPFYRKDGERVYCKTAYLLDISGNRDANAFYDKIGFVSERKQSRRANLSGKANSNLDVIPDLHGCLQAINATLPRSTYGGGNNKERSALKAVLRGDYQVTYEALARFIDLYEKADHPAVAYLEKLQEWGFFFDPIVAVEDGEEYMFDLEVDPEPGDHLEHAFANGGVVVHNCVSGDTMIRVRVRESGKEPQVSYKRIQDLYNMTTQRVAIGVDVESAPEHWGFLSRNVDVWSWDSQRGFCWAKIQGVFKQTVQEDGVIAIKTSQGRVIYATPKHKFLVKRGGKMDFISTKDLKLGQALCICNEREQVGTEEVVEKTQTTKHGNHMYDLSVENTRCYVANHIVTHNTAMASDVEYLSGMLYPGSVSLVISHSMRGVKLVFEELANHYRRCNSAKQALETEITFGSDQCIARFRSTGLSGKQTRINGVAPDANKGGQGVRGQRCSRILHIDEWIFLPAMLIDSSLMPCASNNENPMAPPEYDLKLTRFIFTSSSGYTFEESFARMDTFRRKFREGDPDYFYMNANYLDMNRYWPGFVKAESVKLWEDTIKIPNPGAWEREILARWSSESGSWYSSGAVKGNPDKGTKGMYCGLADDPHIYYERYNHEDMFILGVDPAQMQDEAGYALIKVLPHKIIVMRSEGIPGQKMGEIAEVIRWYLDHYNIVTIVMDPEQGGRAGVVPELQRPVPKRKNRFTQVEELFKPVWPLKEFLMPHEMVPPLARQMVKYQKFSGTAKVGSLTDLNETMRFLIENGTLVIPENRRPEDHGTESKLGEVLDQKFATIEKGYEALTDQIIAIEATPIEEKARGKGQAKKNVMSAGRFNFSTKGGIKKDRYSALLIAVWEAYYLQQSLLATEEEDHAQFLTMGGLFGAPHNLFGY